MTETELGDLDKQLLNALQWDFPVVARPWAALGERLGLGLARADGDLVIARLRAGILAIDDYGVDPLTAGCGEDGLVLRDGRHSAKGKAGGKGEGGKKAHRANSRSVLRQYMGNPHER